MLVYVSKLRWTRLSSCTVNNLLIELGAQILESSKMSNWRSANDCQCREGSASSVPGSALRVVPVSIMIGFVDYACNREVPCEDPFRPVWAWRFMRMAQNFQAEGYERFLEWNEGPTQEGRRWCANSSTT
ncbi:hypothetical protein KIN20_019405 [Parelaphostrongylus tenuis]|uniref:Uncharacterized protein n=1 Tax=Parelaphostrongylus tenuis TaxID=148309 RepID=A0AAD5N5I1_PARTN|nr:hypothetical protein KIN20_019397 [Parelaphostrongylus tenuis]KAJ1360439.1 hypothetical protein KIN20_019405 [Parelaphostrongylus tenuis]